jgi:cation diffusion facilitator family transporter
MTDVTDSRPDPAHRPFDAPAQGARTRGIRATLWWVLGANVGVAIFKLVYGYVAGTMALQADGLHSVLDASSNVIGLVAMHFASNPPDAGHPYGHRKFETLAAAGIGLLIAGGVVEIAASAVGAVLHGRPAPAIGWGGFAIVGGTIVVNTAVSRLEARAGKEFQSAVLVADAAHTRSDAIASIAVLLSFVAARFHVAWADAAGAAVVLVIIGRTAYIVLRDSGEVFADTARLDPVLVRRVVLAVDGVRGCHSIRSRGPRDHIHVDMHLLADPDLTIAEAHDLAHRVESALRDRFTEVADVLVHTEPATPEELAETHLDGREAQD